MRNTVSTAGTARRGRRWAATLAVLGLLLAACGSDDDGDDGAAPSPDPAESGDDGGDAGTDLGDPDPAEGDAVKIGFFHDGRTPSIDNSGHLDAAEALVSYLNEYSGGIAGRPIELVSCAGEGDPGKSTECANRLIQDGVVAVVVPETQTTPAVAEVLRDNEVPLFAYALTDSAILGDPDHSFVIAGGAGALADLPIAVAKENGLEQVTSILIDVPAVTDFYENIGADMFAEAGIEWRAVRVPLGQADMTPQTQDIATGPDTVVQIIGHDAFCISGMRGLEQAGFTGPITTTAHCTNQNTVDGVGSYIEGVYLPNSVALGDPEDEDIARFEAILDEFGASGVDIESSVGVYVALMAFHLAVDPVEGDITSASVTTTIKSMDGALIPGGQGLEFRCNGNAVPGLPAVCGRGSLVTQVDASGDPVLPYDRTDQDPIPD